MTRPAMKRRKDLEEDKHECIFTVTIAKASAGEQGLLGKEKTRPLSRLQEAVKAQTYFHCSYKLLPGEKETTKTDVVTFGIAAKLYAENESRVLRTWHQGKLTWVAWKNSHRVEITKDVLLKLFKHTFELKVWDSKDRLSTRARFDRPKGFKLPQARGSDEVDFMEIHQALEKSNIVVDDFPYATMNGTEFGKRNGVGAREKSFSGKKRVVISEGGKCYFGRQEEETEINNQGNAERKREVDVKVVLDKSNRPEFNKLLTLASSGIQDTTDDEDTDAADVGKGAKDTLSITESRSFKGRTPNSSAHEKRRRNDQHALFIHQQGLACVPLAMSQLFTGITTIVNTLVKPVGTIESLIVTINVDCPLLSPAQKKILNPMVFSLLTVSNLPERQVKEKDISYKDTYASYKFLGSALHVTRPQKHSKKIHFNDDHVVLLGTLCHDKIVEYLQGPPLQVEIHDRERNWQHRKDKCQAFGAQEGDLLLGDVSYLSGVNVAKNPFLGKEVPWSPYGIAKVDLSGLLGGEKFMDVEVPIFNCPLPHALSENSAQRRDNAHIPNYLESGSALKMQIELAHPISRVQGESMEQASSTTSTECPLNRVIYIFNYNNNKMLRQLLSLILRINAEALQLEEQPRDILEAALSTYKLTDEEKESKTLDIVTGFQVIDGQFHIFVLEGLNSGAISRLWNALPQGNVDGTDKIRAHYNSDLIFSERLYLSLDVDITRVRLHKPLSEIVQQPLLYVRDMIPKSCYEAVVKLHQLTKTEFIGDAVRNQLFPSAESIVELSKEFGIPLTLDDIQGLESRFESEDSDAVQGIKTLLSKQNTRSLKTSRAWTPIDYRNSNYEELLHQRSVHFAPKDFIQSNKLEVASRHEKLPEARISCDLSELHLQRAHNYSTQSMNSSVRAKQKMTETLKKDPGFLYTYTKEFQSGTFTPVDIDQLRKEEKALSQKAWQTLGGFVYPGKKSFIESNQHPQKPNFARLDELKMAWKENVLHANILKPSVDRILFPPPLRQYDFDVLTPPKPYFGTKMPQTIFLAGDTLIAEQRKAFAEEQRSWANKLVVDDPALRTHRRLIATELTKKGDRASSQLEKLEDILKDTPQKFSLAAKEMRLEKIPPLSVVLQSSARTIDSNKSLPPHLPLSSRKKAYSGDSQSFITRFEKEKEHSLGYCGDG